MILSSGHIGYTVEKNVGTDSKRGSTRSRSIQRTMKNGVFWDVTPCGSLRTDVSEELSASFIRVTRIGELGTMLVTEIIFSQRASVASCS
jgi:hypothetical protein